MTSLVLGAILPTEDGIDVKIADDDIVKLQVLEGFRRCLGELGVIFGVDDVCGGALMGAPRRDVVTAYLDADLHSLVLPVAHELRWKLVAEDALQGAENCRFSSIAGTCDNGEPLDV